MPTGNSSLLPSKALARLDARFGLAQTAADYMAVGEDALRLASKSVGLDAFRARLIAADCRYWAAQEEQAQRATLLTTLAAELADAAEPALEALAQAPNDVLERFASLVDATARLTLAATQTDAQAAQGWQKLAHVVECSLPVRLVFDEKLWGAEWRLRSITAAGGLAAISLAHGDEQHGKNRIIAALELSLAGNDVLDYREACGKAYGVLKECWQLRPTIVVMIIAVQRAILDHIDRWRSSYRSRVGRLWIAQLFDTLVNQFQCDMGEPILPAIDVAASPSAAESIFAFLREQLLRTIESGKSRLLLDQLAWGARPLADVKVEAQILAQERALLALPPNTLSGDALVQREVQLVSRLPMLFWQDPQQDPQALRAKVEQIRHLEAQFAAHNAGLEQVEYVTDVEALTDELGDREAIIEYAIPRDTLHPASRIYAVAITKKGIQRHLVQSLDVLKQFPQLYHGDIGGLSIGGREPVEESPLGELVFQTRLAVQQDTEIATPWLKLLHMLLIEPLAQIGIKPEDFDCWYVVPHGVLHAVPFRALINVSGGFLNSSVALCIAPSASVWAMLHRPWDAPGRFVGLADPKLDGTHWRALPNTQAEIRSAAELLTGTPSELFVQRDATLEAFARAAPDSSILHIASHGDFPEANVIDFHQMLLTPGRATDGRLTAELVRHSNLRGTRLAVLSVCDGGLHRVGAGDELYGLVPAVFEAGADNVLTTLWRVDDISARLWMRELYKFVAALGPAKAAQKACDTFIASGASIRDWAAFVLIGGGG